jgi:hypothetical protein
MTSSRPLFPEVMAGSALPRRVLGGSTRGTWGLSPRRNAVAEASPGGGTLVGGGAGTDDAETAARALQRRWHGPAAAMARACSGGGTEATEEIWQWRNQATRSRRC